MKIQIKSKYNKVIVEAEGENIKEVVEKNKANLEAADLREFDLRGCDLRGANLQRAYFQGCDLRQSDLRGCDLRGASLWGAKIKKNQQQDIIKALEMIVED